MADDIIKPNGAPKSSKPDAGSANLRSVPVFGVVKNNIDPIRAGRIQVYIADMGSNNPDDSAGWVTVSYMSPFFGWVQPKAGETGNGDFKSNPSSYGFWNSPPDIGTTVLCIFVNGDPNYGYYIGCIPQPEALYMVPAIGASDYVIPNTDGESNAFSGATRLPVTNINTNNSSIANSPGFIQLPRPVHSYSAAIMTQQGIIKDNIRGPISSSAQRETPSRVGWGVSTPGRPIFEGGYDDNNIPDALEKKTAPENLKIISRRGGHSLVMDDGDLIGNDQLVRIRTSLGHQILMSDNGQTLLILHSNGQSYIELGKEGTIDLYSTNSVNIRTQGDLNLHADNNINIHAEKKLNIHAEEMNVHSEKDTTHKVGGNYSVYTVGTHTHKVLGSMSFKSNGDSSFASSADTYINGAKINLNTGSSSTTPQAIPPIQKVAHTDTLHDVSKGWVGAPGKLKSITSRAPAHMPWADAGKGVDVKVSGSASAVLASSPAPQVESANKTAAASNKESSVTQANISTVPNASAPSKTIDSTTASAMVGSVAQQAATNPATAQAVKAGIGVANVNGKVETVVGQLAMTVDQMGTAGIIKPGAASLVNTLVQGGASPESVLTPNMFTGKDGVTDINSFLKNTGTQVNAQITNFQKSQTALTNSGVMTGKESPTSVSGIVMAGATVGVLNTLTQVKTLTGATNNLPTTGVSGIVSAVTKSISSGNYAASAAQLINGGRAITTSLSSEPADALVANQGAVTSAFTAILASLVPLKTKEPQNLKEIALKNAKARNNKTKEGVFDALSTATTILGIPSEMATRGIQGSVNAIGAISRAGSPAELISAASSLFNNVTSLSKNIADNGIISTPAAGPLLIPTILPEKQNSGQVNSQMSSLNLLKSVTGAVKATTELTNAKDVTSIVRASTKLYNSVNKILPSPASIASGINNLPGGESLAASSDGSQLIENSTACKLVSSSTSAAMNGISISTSLKSGLGEMGGTLSSLSNNVDTLLTNNFSKLKSGKSTLSSLAVDDLPIDSSTAINSAIESVSKNANNAVKTPVAGEDTFDRSGQESQIRNMLGDPKIPAPNFSGSVDTARASVKKLDENKKQILELSKEISKLQFKAVKAKNEFESLQDTLPKGSAQINEARLKWMDLETEIAEKNNILKTLST